MSIKEDLEAMWADFEAQKKDDYWRVGNSNIVGGLKRKIVIRCSACGGPWEQDGNPIHVCEVVVDPPKRLVLLD